MKVLFLVTSYGYAFINQARVISKGCLQIGLSTKVIRIEKDFPENEVKSFNPDVLVGVGSWKDYTNFVEIPQEMGFRAIPWIVSDEGIENYVRQLNDLPLILTTSSHSRDIMVRDGLREDKIKVLPEAVDRDFWKPMSLKDLKHFSQLISISDSSLKLPLKYDLWSAKENKVPILFTTGGDVTSKGALEVIAALGLLYKKGLKNFIYLIKTWPSAGSFEKSAVEYKLAKKFGIDENLRYISGEFSQQFLRGLMNICDIYVAPSRSEGFGLPLVEAQMSQKPVITSNATATSETVINGRTGYVVKAVKRTNELPHADIDNLAFYLNRLITNLPLAKRLGIRARKSAVERYSPRVIAEKFAKLVFEKS